MLRVRSPAILVALSVVYRLPALVNAAGTNSDAAVVGLQARHILEGEHAFFLWGSRYQTAADSYVAAAWFALLGATPLALMLSTLASHCALTLFAYATVRRRLEEAAAFVLSLVLVFTSSPVHTYVLYPPREASLALAFAATWIVDAEWGEKHEAALGSENVAATRLAMGVLVAGLSVLADPYALLVAAMAIALAWFVASDAPPGRSRTKRRLAAIAGAAAGFAPYAMLALQPQAGYGKLGWRADRAPHNLELLVDACLPWLLGAKDFVAKQATEYAPVAMPRALSALAWAAGAAVMAAPFVALAPSFAPPLATRSAPTTPRAVRRLGIVGAGLVVATFAAFAGSVMVFDCFAARYLVAIVLALPFALAPFASRFGTRWTALLLAPHLAFTTASGWLGYAPFVHGVVPVVAFRGDEERALRAELTRREVDAVVADYWVSYRLAFLFDESPIAVPLHAEEDRYPPYRARFTAAHRVAYVFDPFRSRESLDVGARLAAAQVGVGAPRERFAVAGWTVLVFDRAR